MAFSMKLPAARAKKKQYGLVLPAASASGDSSASTSSVFAAAAASSASEAATRRQVTQEAARSFQHEQVARTRRAALEEDPTVFDYDGVYDEMTAARAGAAEAQRMAREAEKRKPKYISTLLEQAKIREVEHERIRERRLLHERQREDAQFGDKEKLVSASYKRKLQELKRWDAEDARLDALEAAEDVAKQGEGAMAGFYANLMTKNIAMGGDTANARSAYTAKGGKSQPEQATEPQDDHEAVVKKPRVEGKAGDEEQHSEKTRDEQHVDKTKDEEHEQVEKETRPAVKRQEESLPKVDKADTIAAARARFLARKAQRTATNT